MSCSISIEAYSILLLHPSKFPTSSTCGLLIGIMDQYEPSKTIITDVIPVCHHAPIGPIFDFAADMASTANKSKENIGVIGCYQCHAQADQTSPYMDKISSSIKKRNGTCVFVMIKNKIFSNFNREKLNITCSRDHQELQCEVYNSNSNQTKHTIATANQVALTLLTSCNTDSKLDLDVNVSGLLSDVEDYMSHNMNNSATDFFNGDLKALIQKTISAATSTSAI